MSNKIERVKNLIADKVQKVEFLEYKSKIIGTLFMSCTFFMKNNVGQLPLARGISICSLSDPFNRKKGKKFAYGRAAKALATDCSSSDFRYVVVKHKKIKRTFLTNNDDNWDEFEKIINNIYKYNRIKKGEKVGYEFIISNFYPLSMAKMVFRYKSEYMPTPIVSDLLAKSGIYEVKR